jgi:hypothetical protein
MKNYLKMMIFYTKMSITSEKLGQFLLFYAETSCRVFSEDDNQMFCSEGRCCWV